MKDKHFLTNNEAQTVRGKLTDGLKASGSAQAIKSLASFNKLAIGLMMVAILALSVLYAQARRNFTKLEEKMAAQSADPALKVKEQTQNLLGELEKFIVLPKDETPTIATVTNLDQLKDQPFFKQAQIGDKVIIYSKSEKAILYRPEAKKIIELAPLAGSSLPQQ